MKRLLLDGKELMYAEERARVVAEAKPWVLSMQHAPILRLAFIRELAGIARLQAEDIERQYGLAQPVTSRPFPDGGWQKGRSGFNRRGDGRFSNWSPRPAPEPRVRVKDVRERMLQCFLSYPHLVSEFSHSIEEEFLASPHPAAGRIIEVWRAAAAEDEEGDHVNPASLLMRLAQSDSIAYYEGLLAEELSTGTPEEGARLEVRIAFIELELERTKARIEMLAHDAARDMDAMRRLNDRRAELQRMANEARMTEREYRLRIENQARFESQHAVDKSSDSEPAPLSSNPIIAQLQRFLRGAPETAAAAGVQDSQPARVSTNAVREALAARSVARSAEASAGGLPEDLPEANSVNEVDFVLSSKE